MTSVVRGCGLQQVKARISGMSGRKAETKERNSRVHENLSEASSTRVPRDTRNLVGSRGDHPPSLNTTWLPIVKQYCEGKVKRTPDGE